MQQAAMYKTTEVTTADRVRIITLLYEGALNFIKVAERRIEAKDVAGKGLYIVKATAIISELSNSLDMKAGGEIAANLHKLYDFVLARLLYANIHNDTKALHEAEKVIDLLKGAWKELERGCSVPVQRVANGGVGMELRV